MALSATERGRCAAMPPATAALEPAALSCLPARASSREMGFGWWVAPCGCHARRRWKRRVTGCGQRGAGGAQAGWQVTLYRSAFISIFLRISRSKNSSNSRRAYASYAAGLSAGGAGIYMTRTRARVGVGVGNHVDSGSGRRVDDARGDMCMPAHLLHVHAVFLVGLKQAGRVRGAEQQLVQLLGPDDAMDGLFRGAAAEGRWGQAD